MVARRLTLLALVALLAGACGASSVSPSATAAPPTATAAGATAAPATPAPTPSPSTAVATVAAPLEPSTLDITSNTENAIPAILLYNVLETLTELHSDGSITPLLAKAWDLSADGRTYTFHLNDANFQDGTPMTADDVVWTFSKRHATTTDPDTGVFATMDKIVAVDPHTVQITLSAPSNSFLTNISTRAGVVLAERSYASIADHPVGTGPFKFAQWQRRQSLTLDRFDGYWGTKAKLAGVTFKFITDKNAELNAFLAGELDILALVGEPSRVGEIQSNPALKLDVGSSNVVQLLALNNAKAPLTDLRVRQAIAYAIDRDAINKTAENGNGTASAVFASKLDPYFDGYNPYPYDPAKAMQLLADAGFPKGALNLTLTFVVDDPNAIIGQVLQGQLAAVGINVKLDPVDIGTYVDKAMTKYNYDLATVGHISARLSKFICDPTAGTGGWYVHFCDKTTSDALKLADSVTDRTESIRQYQIATHRLADQVGAIAIYSWPSLSATSTKVSGFPTTLVNETMDMRNVDIAP